MKSENKKPKYSKVTAVDEEGNSITLIIPQGVTIDEWMRAFRKILTFQEFHPETIDGYLGA